MQVVLVKLQNREGCTGNFINKKKKDKREGEIKNYNRKSNYENIAKM